MDDTLAVLACAQGGRHLLNALRFLGVDPAKITTQADALEIEWPTPWAYDVWCAWHACEIALSNSGYALPRIDLDRRTTWRTAARFAG